MKHEHSHPDCRDVSFLINTTELDGMSLVMLNVLKHLKILNEILAFFFKEQLSSRC